MEEILDDGTCSVVFDKYGTVEFTKICLIRPAQSRTDSDDDEYAEEGGRRGGGAGKTKKDLSLAQREYKKKKAQKKAQRLKQHEDEREQDKNKWISFNAKVP